jgi:phage gpG-like protein
MHVGFDDGPIRRHLAALALLHASGFDRARREIGEFMVGEVHDNLHRQKLVDGSPMPKSKAAIKRDGKTLIDKGHLRDSYVYQLTAAGVEVGSAKVYAAIHHFGGDRAIVSKHGPVRPLPPRPVLGLNADGEREVGDILLGELRRAQRI